jgi:hypothetical protein
VERQNLTMRMQMRRFTRLTNAFSKKIETICTKSRCFTCGTTSAMEAGLSSHIWSIQEIVQLGVIAEHRVAA